MTSDETPKQRYERLKAAKKARGVKNALTDEDRDRDDELALLMLERAVNALERIATALEGKR